MFGFFKFVMYLGVGMGIAGFVMSMNPDQAWAADLPPNTQQILSFGGLALIVVGLAGRSATRPDM